MRIVLTVLAVLALAGCASNELSEQEMALITAQMESKTFEIECPAGCKVAYKDPRDKAQIPRNTNGWDAAIAVSGSVERLVGAAIVPAAMGAVAVEGFKAMKNSGAITTTTTTNTSTNTRTEVGDYSGDYSGSTGDYSGTQSGNAGELVSDNSGSVRSPIDNTSEPTVVNQPEPIVVDQPAPIVVQP